MPEKTVTVVIPCFNCGASLLLAVESVKAQSWPCVEIIVVDDGSTDPISLQIIESLSGVTLIRQLNLGLSSARNNGIKAAVSEYVLPLDSDDWLEPNAISELVTHIENDSRASFSFSHIRLEGELSGVLKKSYNQFEQLFVNQLPYCLLMKRSTWEELGGYDSLMTQGYEDWDFNIRLGAKGHGAVVPRPLFHYNVSSNGMLLSQSNRLHGQLWAYIQHKNSSLYSPRSLFRTWRTCRRQQSTYPLLIYPIWLLVHRLSPSPLFRFIFENLRPFSHSRRTSIQQYP